VEAAQSSALPAVVVEGLSKRFEIPHHQYSTFKERALHPFQGRTSETLHAIDDVSFSVGQGEFFGVVGRNGSGKSTLLKALAGIYEADKGHALVRGRLSPFIELGVGFNPDLTARDNVIINAIMLGLTRKQARERFDDIIAFAELENFLALKLKNYSSGMQVRLAFSVAIQVDADVLLVDEVLAVGDAAFQQKCFDQFHRLKDSGRTIIFVTHDMSAVERFCDRALLLERGGVVSIDAPHAIARAYNELNFGRLRGADGQADPRAAPTGAEIKAAWFENQDGERVAARAQGEPLRLCAEILFHGDVEQPGFAMHLRSAARHTVFATTTHLWAMDTGTFAAGEVVRVQVAMENWLAPGRYDLTPTVSTARGGADVLDVREDLAQIMIHGMRQSGAVVDIPHTLELQRI
jgi:ABC-type polysaccharide/polyol phosphate transport system ATPase subunit